MQRSISPSHNPTAQPTNPKNGEANSFEFEFKTGWGVILAGSLLIACGWTVMYLRSVEKKERLMKGEKLNNIGSAFFVIPEFLFKGISLFAPLVDLQDSHFSVF